MNTVVHALSDRYGAVHLHACEGAWVTDRAMWSADRQHPGEPGHRRLAVRFHELLTSHGAATGPAPSPGSDSPAPARWASLRWPATAGTGWVARRCTDLLPQLLSLAVDEMRHHARGTSSRLDLRASAAVSTALAALPTPEQRRGAAQECLPDNAADRPGVPCASPQRRTARKRTGVPGGAWAAAGRSVERTTAITG
ncbi:hypothetical protein [Streptomyces sp. NPDC058698]|uniref:hypothetical protein n=1 Tax=Streptomyces sp. NPDC058698 TaxID=3346606 RepID=UPI00364E0D97